MSQRSPISSSLHRFSLLSLLLLSSAALVACGGGSTGSDGDDDPLPAEGDFCDDFPFDGDDFCFDFEYPDGTPIAEGQLFGVWDEEPPASSAPWGAADVGLTDGGKFSARSGQGLGDFQASRLDLRLYWRQAGEFSFDWITRSCGNDKFFVFLDDVEVFQQGAEGGNPQPRKVIPIATAGLHTIRFSFAKSNIPCAGGFIGAAIDNVLATNASTFSYEADFTTSSLPAGFSVGSFDLSATGAPAEGWQMVPGESQFDPPFILESIYPGNGRGAFLDIPVELEDFGTENPQFSSERTSDPMSVVVDWEVQGAPGSASGSLRSLIDFVLEGEEQFPQSGGSGFPFFRALTPGGGVRTISLEYVGGTDAPQPNDRAIIRGLFIRHGRVIEE